MRQFSPIKERILQYIEYKGLSKYKFYQDSGITRGVLDKESGISEDNIAKFVAYESEINLYWLITGKGEMFVEQKGLSQVNEQASDYQKESDILEMKNEIIALLRSENKLLKEKIERLSGLNPQSQTG